MRARLHIVVSGCFAAVILTSVLTANDARAQPQPTPDQLAQARTLFERGIAFADQERWGEALEYLRRSRAVVERPSTVFNIGNVLVRLGRPIEAVAAFRDFLRISNASQDATARAQATQLMATAQASIARLRLSVAPAVAEIRLDGALVRGIGPTRDLELDPGRHTIQVSATGYTSRTFTVSTLPGSRSERQVELSRGTQERNGRIVVSASVARATVYIDGEAAGRGTAQLEARPGRHRVEVTARGYETFRSTVDVAAGGQASVQAAMEASGSGGSVFTSPVFWVITGAVLVGGGVGLGLALSTSGGDGPGSDYGGTTGVILQGLSRP